MGVVLLLFKRCGVVGLTAHSSRCSDGIVEGCESESVACNSCPTDRRDRAKLNEQQEKRGWTHCRADNNAVSMRVEEQAAAQDVTRNKIK